MFTHRAGHTGVEIRRRAQLKRNPTIAHIRCKPAEHRMPGVEMDVLDDAHAMAQPFGAAQLQRLPDARQAVRLARVDREMRVLAAQVVECRLMRSRREAFLRTGDVETDHT